MRNYKYDKIKIGKRNGKNLCEVERMKWQEVRELFPDQFVLVSILNYHEEGNKKIVDEVDQFVLYQSKRLIKSFFKQSLGIWYTILQIKNL